MKRLLLVLILIAAGVATGYYLKRRGQDPAPAPPLPLATLTAEHIKQFPDPHQPMPARGSALWCASTHAAWRQLPGILHVPAPALTAQPELSGWLNAAADPAGYVPPGALFSFAGPANQQTITAIRDGVRRQFGEDVMLPLKAGGPNDFIAFARLQVEAAFPIPYADSQDGLSFRDAAGKTAKVRAFSIDAGPGREEMPGLRSQPVVLFADPRMRSGAEPVKDEFALNLSGEKADVHVIAACLPRPVSLHAAWEHVQKRTKDFSAELDALEEQEREPGGKIGRGVARHVSGDLTVPLLAFENTSNLPEMEGSLTAPPGARIDSATQAVQFRLEKTGAKLKAETLLGGVMSAMPGRDYHFDRPFLLAMIRSGAPQPFFLLWVDDAAMMAKF